MIDLTVICFSGAPSPHPPSPPPSRQDLPGKTGRLCRGSRSGYLPRRGLRSGPPRAGKPGRCQVGSRISERRRDRRREPVDGRGSGPPTGTAPETRPKAESPQGRSRAATVASGANPEWRLNILGGSAGGGRTVGRGRRDALEAGQPEAGKASTLEPSSELAFSCDFRRPWRTAMAFRDGDEGGKERRESCWSTSPARV